MDGVLSQAGGTQSNGGGQGQNGRGQEYSSPPTHRQQLDPPAQTYMQGRERISSAAIPQETRQDPPALRFQVVQEGTTRAQESPVHVCQCGHRNDLSATSSREIPPLETRGQAGEKRGVENDMQEEFSGRSQESGTLPAKRPPKDRWPPSRVSSDATTILLDTLPVLPRDSRNDGVQGMRGAGMAPSRQQSGIDYFVPVALDEKTSYSRLPRSRLTVSERLQPTIDAANATREKLAKKAKNTKYIQNGAIGLQVLLGSLTTGLSAVATTGRQMAVQTTILGGLTTIVASYLAKTRNSDEAEKCRARVNELDKFIRTGTAFLLDYGHSDDAVHDKMVEEMRSDFEELLGNGAIERHQIECA